MYSEKNGEGRRKGKEKRSNQQKQRKKEKGREKREEKEEEREAFDLETQKLNLSQNSTILREKTVSGLSLSSPFFLF